MKRCIGGTVGGISNYKPKKSYYDSIGWTFTIGGLPLRHRPVPGGPHRTTGIDFSLLKSNT